MDCSLEGSDSETLNFDDPTICTNCTDKLDTKVYILCANSQCRNPQVRLCLFCFSCSAELRGHRKNHAYRVVNSGGLTLFATVTPRPLTFPVWGSKEEECLLETVERYNLGNWEDAVKLIGAGDRSSLDAKLHYDKYYIHGRIGQLTLSSLKPPSCIDLSVRCSQFGPEGSLSSPDSTYNKTTLTNLSKKSKTVNDILNHTLSVNCCSLPTWLLNCQTSPPVKTTTLKQNPDDLKLIAYMPHRDDFEKEWNNDAESAVASITSIPSSDDLESDLERRLKFTIVDAYMQQVRERRWRKLVVRDYDLVPRFLKEQKPKLHSSSGVAPIQFRALLKEEKELAEDLRKFAQFIKKDDYNSLVAGVVKERALMERIKAMQKLKKKGIQKLDGKLKSFDVSSLPLSNIGSNGILKKRRRKNRLRFSHTHQKSVSRFIRWRKYIARQGEVETRPADVT